MQTQIQELTSENDKMKDKYDQLKVNYDRLIRESVQFFTQRKRRRTSVRSLSVLDEISEVQEPSVAAQPGRSTSSVAPMLANGIVLQDIEIEIIDEVLDTPPMTPQLNSSDADDSERTMLQIEAMSTTEESFNTAETTRMDTMYADFSSILASSSALHSQESSDDSSLRQ